MFRFPALVLAGLSACLVAASAADFGKQLLDAAARGGDVGQWIARGAPVDARDKKGRTPLMLAAQSGHGEAVRVLLEKGADPWAKDQAGATAWMLAVFAPAGNRDNQEVVKLLPRPARPKIAVEAVWSGDNLNRSCILRSGELVRTIAGFELDRVALTALGRYAAASGRNLAEIVAGNARGRSEPAAEAFEGSDGVLVLKVRPGAGCSGRESGDQLSLTLEVQLLRANDRVVLFGKIFGGGTLKSLESPVVTSEVQYLPVYERWIKPYAEQAFTAAVEAWFRAQ